MNSGKPKILHLIQSLESGGCENMLLRTLPLLNNFEHKIITLKRPGELAPKFESAGIIVDTINYDGLFDIPGILSLRKFVRRENPNIIITYLFHADMLGRLALRGVIQAPIIPFLRTTYNHPKYLVARILEWLTKPLVSRYLANSQAVKDFYVNHIGVRPEKISVIQNGIDIKYYDSITPDPKLKQSLGIEPDDFVIICVANLNINKGHRYLLEAFESVFQRHPELQLLLVGEGDERGNLGQQIMNYRSEGNIHFLGRRFDVPQLLKISNLFVLPTLFEGQSNAILEAMATGVPIITTNIAENYILIKDGVSGRLITPRSSSAIASAIKEIFADKEESRKRREKARQDIENDFSLPDVKKKFETTISSFL